MTENAIQLTGLIRSLRRLSIETNSLACLGCAGSACTHLLRVLTQAFDFIGVPVWPHDLLSHKLELSKSPEYPGAVGVGGML